MDGRIMKGFGSKTFDKKRMKKKLPYPIYLKWKDATRKEDVLDKETADIIAHAMKEWAIENGAKYYCHWFQPLNGLTAKKLEGFLDRNDENEPMIRFSGKELIKSEPDASSFPSGGMRSTFEARGYTYWDCTANAFIVDEILYIPSIFVSFNGASLDKKGPLLRSMDYISHHGTRVMNRFSREKTYRLRIKVGLEQEFFLIDREVFEKRQDLMSCGRTLFGARPSKAQELSDHYFGAIPDRVKGFYDDVNIELEKLGIYPKTEHNEVAPCQFEIAMLFENANIAVDYNLMTMDVLKRVAKKHGLVCLLGEKPFEYVNGSGKHNNWSLATNYGENCFGIGKTEKERLRFALFCCAVIKAVDQHPTLLRFAASCPENDYRLGADEAPPAIVSIFLGDQVEKLIYDVAGLEHETNAAPHDFKISNLGYIPHDESDRNRTSPFAFTGNKFEFRMLGSSMNASDVNICLNTAVGEVLEEIADRIEDVPDEKLPEEVQKICREILEAHSRILFSGDGYSKEWEEEAERRGLPNVKTYRDSVDVLLEEKTKKLFSSHGIYTEQELAALYEIALEEIVNKQMIEIHTFIRMMDQLIVPTFVEELKELGHCLDLIENPVLEKRTEWINREIANLIQDNESLKEMRLDLLNIHSLAEKADCLKKLIEVMQRMRGEVDRLEVVIAKKNWPMPSYEDIFASIE